MSDTSRKTPPAAGKGRPKGAKNKVPKALKDIILQALANKGGVTYLEEQAEKNPNAFLALIGRVLPLQVKQDSTEPMMPRQPLYKQLPDD